MQRPYLLLLVTSQGKGKIIKGPLAGLMEKTDLKLGQNLIQ